MELFKTIFVNTERNWLFSTNSDFQIPISLEPNVVNLWYFKLIFFDLTKVIVWNFKGLWRWNPKILGLENQSLLQRVNSFDLFKRTFLNKIKYLFLFVFILLNLKNEFIIWIFTNEKKILVDKLSNILCHFVIHAVNLEK